MLRPGGMMLYSTCTFDPSENEETIEYLLEEYPEFTICEMAGYEGFAQGIPEVTKNEKSRPCKNSPDFPAPYGRGRPLSCIIEKGKGSP